LTEALQHNNINSVKALKAVITRLIETAQAQQDDQEVAWDEDDEEYERAVNAFVAEGHGIDDSDVDEEGEIGEDGVQKSTDAEIAQEDAYEKAFTEEDLAERLEGYSHSRLLQLLGLTFP
jgi:hypothetical protein